MQPPNLRVDNDNRMQNVHISDYIVPKGIFVPPWPGLTPEVFG
jgi:hypothetical protein